MATTTVDIEARLIHSTIDAMLFETEMQNEIWLPKAACQFDEDTGTLTLRESLAIEKELV